MSAPLRDLPQRFRQKLRIPAVAGGVLYRDGSFVDHAVGVRRRGSDDPVQLSAHRDRIAVLACNDGRSRVLLRSARLAAEMLGTLR